MKTRKKSTSNSIIKISALILEYRLMFFYIISIIFFELLFRLWVIKSINKDFLFPVIFAITAGIVFFIMTSLFSPKVNKLIAICIFTVLILYYNIQLIYFSVFQAPFSLYSMTGAGDVMQFWAVVVETVLKNIIAVLLFCVPLVIILLKRFKLDFARVKKPSLYYIIALCIVSYAFSILCINLTGNGNVSQYTVYYKTYSPQLSVSKLGLLTTMRLDMQKLILGDNISEHSNALNNEDFEEYEDVANTTANGANVSEPSSEINQPSETDTMETITETIPETTAAPIEYNTMNIDFDNLIANEKNETLLTMHKYFNSVQPTKKNKYTGIFKGYNLILITAEGFSDYVISEDLTPTLYKMKNEGFLFKNFYNPVWGVSTSDGEYVACTGLMPKGGVWSFAKSGANYMPFVMGNQFKKLGYPTRAYHNHTYTYYKRNISHPNMGYDYKGLGNGLVVKKTWPESDLEMIDVTAPEYIGPEPFHTYYMTVSGHLQYNFSGNYIAHKNKQYVEHLPYSDTCKAYIACNLELEFAMKALMEKLEAEGIAEKTVIAISADHYPYGLPRENIDEIAGHKVDDTFGLYKSALILYVKGMEPVIIDKPCASLDIIPTLSNLFGLEYDSRLLMGRDILSDEAPLVIFSSMSWITDRAMYDTKNDTVMFIDGTEDDKDYIKSINRIVAGRYKNSARILEQDYYRRVFKD